jgi:hypothetical protein
MIRKQSADTLRFLFGAICFRIHHGCAIFRFNDPWQTRNFWQCAK